MLPVQRRRKNCNGCVLPDRTIRSVLQWRASGARASAFPPAAAASAALGAAWPLKPLPLGLLFIHKTCPKMRHIFINQDRHHYNQHLFANEKQVCLFLVSNSMCQDSVNSWKAFSASRGLRERFPCRKLWRCLRKRPSLGRRLGECGGRGKTSSNSFNV